MYCQVINTAQNLTAWSPKSTGCYSVVTTVIPIIPWGTNQNIHHGKGSFLIISWVVILNSLVQLVEILQQLEQDTPWIVGRKALNHNAVEKETLAKGQFPIEHCNIVIYLGNTF